MKLMDAVRAYMAAEEMGKETWPYDIALAVVKVKRALQADMDFFIAQERALVKQYAAVDEAGNIRMTTAGRFLFQDPKEGPAYEASRTELGETEIGADMHPIRVQAPASIKPVYIEALSGFIEFIGGEA